MAIKYVMLNLTNVLIDTEDGKRGSASSTSFARLTDLIEYFHCKGLRCGVVTNSAWEKNGESLRESLKSKLGVDDWFSAEIGDMPKKPNKASIETILKKIGCGASECVFIGNSEQDMRTAVNSKILFINVVWFRQRCDYGFTFRNENEVIRFFDTCLMRDHSWQFDYTMPNGSRFLGLAPAGSMGRYAKYAPIFNSARLAAKNAIGAEFWGQYICSSLYLSGLHESVDYYAPFPCHTSYKWRDSVCNALDIFGKCFRGKYIPDLICRHADIPQSQKNKHLMSHELHLSSLKLNPTPIKSTTTGSRFARPPLRRGKTVLIIDDFTTNGHSLDSARFLIQKTGANVIMLSWLKFVTKPFQVITSHPDAHKFNPYQANSWDGETLDLSSISYSDLETNLNAWEELDKSLKCWDSWG